MFCPKCATQNIDGARFCRGCGVDVSLIPLAMSGRLPEPAPAPMIDPSVYVRGRRRNRRPPSYESAFGSLGMGIAMAVISIMIWQFAPGGFTWWYWMLIPAFSLGFKGVGQLARLKFERPEALPSAPPPQMAVPPQPQWPEFAPYNTSELMPPPPSVTEGTTRHLGQEGPTRVFEVRAELPKQDS